ncbi:GH39 family glycosyl hydrolase [Reichenbachiella ulvae]|uniref:Glycosyl hydrolases family 39 N-terminal catalytic domain-containing protein n=1 Tax=Reichenbachiella ulvae TaxID=2980104 RepID=A0ABT3CT89_9BACT|nr:hypothetical protein [Reichenbachiella ulvae]MCV9386685.1 hypothetical protein [Reichenbachiella ulvae]
MKVRLLKRLKVLVTSVSTIIWFLSCTGEGNLGKEILQEDKEDEIPADQLISINTKDKVGLMYNFWSTRPMINQTQFESASFRSSLEESKSYVKSYNLVRMLGGRIDNKNIYYKGVDENGNIIVDFSGLLTSMRGFMQTGFKPRIVLDNVPWEMSLPRIEDTYGNTKAPTDYEIWRQYIRAFLQTLIDEFGKEEVSTWRFRVSTEPNYTPDHWRGSMEAYFKHYDITVDEVGKILPEAQIGPGNMLTEGVATFTTELIDHCAVGTNYATGEIGTRMDFFSLSYYEKIDQNTVRFEEKVVPYRDKLDSYSQFQGIPLDIQEFGILRDEFGNRGLSLSDATEFGASWYATIADLSYHYRVNEIYDWGQYTTGGLASGRRNVTSMLLKMEGGSRLSASRGSSGFSGIIPVVKEGRVFLLLYNHNTTLTSMNRQILYPEIKGELVKASSSFYMNEWTIDRNHGIFMHELYKDVKSAGIAIKSGKSARIYGNRPGDYFQEGWKAVYDANLNKYEKLAQLPQTVTDSTIFKTKDGSIILKMEMEPHSVKLIELIPK